MKPVVSPAIVASLLAVAACSGAPARFDQFPIARGGPPVRSIAILPGGGAVADAVGAELATRGFTIVPASATASMVKAVDLKTVVESHRPGRTSPGTPKDLRDQLHARGIDALLIVKAEEFAPRQWQDYPYYQIVFCYLYRTDPELMHSQVARWANGDKKRARSPSEAAPEIVNAIARRSSP